MKILGKESELSGIETLIFVQEGSAKPTRMPDLDENEKVICLYNMGAHVKVVVCENLSEVHALYAKYAAGSALTVEWYKGDPSNIKQKT